MTTRPCVLTIAGSDSGGGAGIQADLKAIAMRGVHGASAIAAITAQNSRAVTSVLPLPDSIIEAQIDAVMEDLDPAVVKIGMLGTAPIVRLVARKLRQWGPRQIVLDPVMIASSGARLLDEDAVDALRRELVPMARVLTPNWPEAAALAGRQAGGIEDARALGSELLALGPSAVLLKGGHLSGPEVEDLLLEGDAVHRFVHPRIPEAEGHGTGCALASAVAAGLALGEDLQSAVRAATDLVHRALVRRHAVGRSKPVYLGLFPEP